MTSSDLIRSLKTAAHQNAVAGVMSSLDKPAGRQPEPKLVELSKWFNRLSSDDKEAVKEVVGLATFQSLYNVLLAFDGLIAIGPLGEGGQLELMYRTPAGVVQLNDPNGEALSAILKGA